jgi:signal transduction histidine kinase
VEPVNILMVDDQPAKLLAYDAMLGQLGENLIKANSAREALGHLLREEIALVLMDVSMPEIDGFELAAIIRQHPRCERTAIIFVSAIHMSDVDRVKGYETGAVDYVSVPVIPEILRAKVRVFLQLHRATTELKRLNEELESRVRARTDALQASLVRLTESETRLRQQSETLAESDRRKDEFLAMLAHELRNPLAPIRNSVELMRRHAAENPQLEWIRGMLDRQTTHLVRLVDDLLDASRISRSKLVLTRSRVELTRLVADAVESVRSPLEHDVHEFLVTIPALPIHVDADPVRLTQVVVNLLSNAIKFTPPRGRIVLVVDRVGDHVEIRVRDNGRGIDPDDLGHVFEMFYQGDPGGGGKGGLGLGLTLVRNLVAMHGGTVSASSPGLGQGSEFLVTLPIPQDPAEAQGAPSALPERAVGPQRRVLVVDDNRDAADSLAHLLRLLGDEVEVAFDGATALETLPAFRPDAVLLDIGMPGMDGYATARAIRHMPDGAQILLIAMTGWGQEEDKLRATEAGFDVHLVKPVAIEALFEAFAASNTSAL